jgi:hypothetical protein
MADLQGRNEVKGIMRGTARVELGASLALLIMLIRVASVFVG